MLSFESLKLTKQLRADVWLAINVLGFVWGFFFFCSVLIYVSKHNTVCILLDKLCVERVSKMDKTLVWFVIPCSGNAGLA